MPPLDEFTQQAPRAGRWGAMNTLRLLAPFVAAALLPIAAGCTVEADLSADPATDPSHAVPSVFLPYVASNIGDLALATAPAISVTSTCKIGAKTATEIHSTASCVCQVRASE